MEWDGWENIQHPTVLADGHHAQHPMMEEAAHGQK